MNSLIIIVGFLFFPFTEGYGTTISFSKCYASESYPTLYEFEATLTDGKYLKGSTLHLGYDSVPPYQFTDESFLTFLSRISQHTQGKITLFSQIQPLKLDSDQPWPDHHFGAVIAADLHQVAVGSIQAVKFKQATPADGFVIITQLSQPQINQINQGLPLAYQFNYPLDDNHLEQSDLHLFLGKPNQLPQKTFEGQIKGVYENKEGVLVLNEIKWKKLQLLYRNKGLILMRLVATDYFIAEARAF
jgi:hypothetical protein